MHIILISRDGAARKLVGLITRRSLVQIQLPQPSGIIYEPEKDVTYLIRPTYFLLRIRIPARHK